MIVTLLTDFGTGDYFVAAMKGAILSHQPGIRIVDISHDVPAHDIQTAAFLLLATYRDFPPGTVHTVVVDPGVGTDRFPIAARVGSYLLVGPDNGVLSLVLDRDPEPEVRRIEAPELSRQVVSHTFHGRDIFAPTAAALAAGYPFERLGGSSPGVVRLEGLDNQRTADGSVIGTVLHVDRFGNCVTSLTVDDLGGRPRGFWYHVGGRVVDDVREVYEGAAAGTAFMIPGSAGFLEISLHRGSAAARLEIDRGQPVCAVPRS